MKKQFKVEETVMALEFDEDEYESFVEETKENQDRSQGTEYNNSWHASIVPDPFYYLLRSLDSSTETRESQLTQNSVPCDQQPITQTLHNPDDSSAVDIHTIFHVHYKVPKAIH